MKEFIFFNGENYTCRTLFFEDKFVTVSTETLNSVLLDDNGNYTSEKAQFLDEKIFFFVSDEEILLDEGLLESVLERELC